MTIMSFKQPIASVLTRALAGKSVVCRALNHFFPPVLWLRPKNRNLKWMLWIVKEAISLKLEYIEFMLHSSELMPGGSPNFSTERDIDLLYEDMEQLFEVIKNSGFIGRSLSDYYQLVRPNSKQ